MSNRAIQAFSAVHNLLSVSDFQRAPGKALKRLHNNHPPFIITQRGRPVAILSSLDHIQTEPSSLSVTTSAITERREDLLAALQKMLPLIISRYSPEKIVLFGSLATGNVHENSDIDLVIIKKTTKRFLDRQLDVIRIADADVATDFFVYTPEELSEGIKTKPYFFQDEIMTRGKVLYEK